ncbi:hypothetical protein [Parasedimentitalea psychrophila]|uniref:Uncharacterized protein n=1 Tax=Parasedimentitalea psychrophila TaxID=2997337 RepID=A0A9Y2P757_9RHOB|nr:hypothetical protein [Parasedimentitalea psychrophila]WIY25698.1 hypothetical protein QPJ95_01730 [Parasedimentitalea psychrophila]
MKALLILPTLLVITACEAPNSATRTTANGSTEIKLQNNQNCWDNRCMRYHAYNGTFSIPGRYSVNAPAGAIQSDGYISVAAFQQAYTRASRASYNGRENR